MKPKQLKLKRNRLSTYLFLAPGLLGLAAFYLVPFIVSVAYAFTDASGQVSLRSWAPMGTFAFRLAMKNTLILTTMIVLCCSAVGLLIALLLEKLKSSRAFLTALFLLPAALPVVSVIEFWQDITAPLGSMNRLIYSLGLVPLNWLNSGLARWVVLMIFMWRNVGLVALLILSGLDRVPQIYSEAAKLDGANARQILWRIRLPLIGPALSFAVFFCFIQSFRIFREIWLLSGNYPDESIYTIQHYINNQFRMLRVNHLAAVSLTFALFFSLCIAAFALIGRNANKALEGDV